VSPALLGRAALFGCKLALPANWRCIDPAYFDGECCVLALMRLCLKWLH
jgi:hypothetical protein